MPTDIVLMLCCTASVEALNIKPISGKIIKGARIMPKSIRGSRDISFTSFMTILPRPLNKSRNLREHFFQVCRLVLCFEFCRCTFSHETPLVYQPNSVADVFYL